MNVLEPPYHLLNIYRKISYQKNRFTGLKDPESLKGREEDVTLHDSNIKIQQCYTKQYFFGSYSIRMACIMGLA